MNLYFWLILFAYILILARGVIRGFERGFVKELEGLAAGICAVLTLILISGLVTGSIGREFSTKALAIGLLMVLGIVYSLCRILFSSLKLFAGLPVIRFLDQVLGAGAGVCKSFLLLYVVDHIVKIWLNL
ncbi:MAG: CvpA family protein [Sarcina sp.]|nr:CvpA family protein [Sarcina sp.]